MISNLVSLTPFTGIENSLSFNSNPEPAVYVAPDSGRSYRSKSKQPLIATYLANLKGADPPLAYSTKEINSVPTLSN